ncbi:thioredoxin-disulfide reductase [Psychrilyobacter sp.]|uniref:thioredoxin-disulfide reductase n=1 Tax=Psychrilyobacter sp. TaxID=2586924 RepID=UPI00301783A6
MSKEITIYSKSNCPYCVRAKMLLESKGVTYTEINVQDHPEEKENMIRRSNGGKTFPQIVIEDLHIGGCDELYELDKFKKLDTILGLNSKKVEREHHKLVIIGSGPAGYTAAIYAGRANLKPVLFTGNEKGGQLTTTTDIENFPGFPEGINGVDLMLSMEKQAKKFETKIIFGEITKIDLSKRPFTIYVGKKVHTSDSVIVATGATARYLGIPSEREYKGRGVSACATCDGFFFKGKDVAIVGGGDTAMEEASYLTNLCNKVYLIHRRETFKASQAMQDRVKNNPKIEIIYNSTVEEILGDKVEVNQLKLRSTVNEATSTIDIAGLFVAIGHTPNTSFLDGQLSLDGNGYLLVNDNTSKTNIPGVFSCGDVIDSNYRQAITAAGSGCKAAMDAEHWLEKNR